MGMVQGAITRLRGFLFPSDVRLTIDEPGCILEGQMYSKKSMIWLAMLYRRILLSAIFLQKCLSGARLGQQTQGDSAYFW